MKNSKGIYTAKHIAVISVTVAILIGGQFALSFAAGVEVVTLLLCVFSVTFGIRDGVVAAVAFSLLRCLVFGFDSVVYDLLSDFRSIRRPLRQVFKRRVLQGKRRCGTRR